MKLNFILFSLFFTLLFSAFTSFIAFFLCYIFDIKNYQNISITFFGSVAKTEQVRVRYLFLSDV